MIRPIVLLGALALGGCSTLAGLPEHTRADAERAALIAAEWGDETGFECFSALAAHEVIVPVGPLSVIAAARAARIGRPTACDRVLTDAARRLPGL